MTRYVAPLLLLVLSSVASAETFNLALQMRQAKELFYTHRFRAAEIEFEQLRNSHLPLEISNLDSYLTTLEFLARSISEQGKTERVLDLLEARHVLISRHYDPRGYEFANSMVRLAEALYRADRRDQALTFIDHAILLYDQLKPRPDHAISAAIASRRQYQLSPFDSARLHTDLSDEYSP